MQPRHRMGFAQLIYTSGSLALALALGVAMVSALVYRFSGRFETYRVAVGPPGSNDQRLLRAISGRLELETRGPRLQLVETYGPLDSAKALEQGRADLAVIRSDIATPSNGATILVLHKDVVILAAPAGSTIAKVGDLAKKRVGVFPSSPANASLLDAILSEYDVPTDAVQRILLDPNELTDAIQQKKVDAVLAVGPLRGRTIESVTTALGGKNRQPTLIAIDDAAGMAARNAAYESAEVPAGFFHGSPPLPKEALTTLSVAFRLEARTDLSEETATILTKRIFGMRRLLQAELPFAAAIERPDTERGAADAVHAGALAYYDNTEKSFLDRYGDWIYIGAMTLSGIASGIAALFGVASARARRAALSLIDQLIDLKSLAHETMELPKLATFEKQIEALSTQGLQFARNNNFDEAGVTALRLAIDEARRAIADQRQELEAALQARQETDLNATMQD